MRMMKSRKIKRYARGGSINQLPRFNGVPLPGEGYTVPNAQYMGGFDAEYNYFPNRPAGGTIISVPSSQGVGVADFGYDYGGGGNSGDGMGSGEGTAADADSSDGSSSGDSGSGGSSDSGDAGFARGGSVKLKKKAKGGPVKSKYTRGDGCAIRGRTRGKMV